MDFMLSIWRSTWIKVFIYIIIGIAVNTNPPHLPQFSGQFGAGVILHSIAQYIISVMLWPLSLWSPTFTVGKWSGV